MEFFIGLEVPFLGNFYTSFTRVRRCCHLFQTMMKEDYCD